MVAEMHSVNNVVELHDSFKTMHKQHLVMADTHKSAIKLF